jgi:translation initiation factor 1A
MKNLERCMKQSAQIAVKNVKFHSNLTQADLFTVENAGRNEDHDKAILMQKLKVFLGKKKANSEDEFRNIVLPEGSDILGAAEKMLGFDRVLVKCQDGQQRLCRIRGKMKRRAWVRQGDIVLVPPWDFQSVKRGDIIRRYRRNQAELLRRKGYLKD